MQKIPLVRIFIFLLLPPILLLSLDKNSFLQYILPMQGKILFWINPLLILLTLLQLFLIRKSLLAMKLRPHLSKLMVGALSSIVLVAIVHSICPQRMRIQWDETSLIATSQRMYLAQSGDYVAESTIKNGNISPISLIADKRPPLFPFLVSLLHNVRGMSIANAFLLNRFVLLVFLFSLFWLFSTELGFLPGISAQLLFLSTPLVAICSSSGGFDLLASLLLLFCMASCWKYMQSPSFERLVWLCNIGCFFIYSRYESLLIFCTLLGAALYYTRAYWLQDKRAILLLSLLPFVALPIELIGITCFRYGYFQQDYLLAGGSQFSVSNLVRNFPYFLQEFFTLKFGKAFFGLFSAIGFISIPLLFFKERLSHRTIPIVLAVLCSLVTTLLFYAGNAAECTTARLFLPTAIAGSLAPFLFVEYLPKRIFSYSLVCVSALLFAAQIPGLNAGTVLAISPTAKFAQALDMVLSSHQFPKQSLFVYDVPQFVNMEGYAAMDWPTFQSQQSAILEQRTKQSISGIYLIDMYPEATGSPIQNFIKTLNTKRILTFERSDISLKISKLE